VAGRASIVGAAATHVGKVREHNEDSHYFDVDAGVFVVCDGMGGHAAGEVASALAIRTIRSRWASDETIRTASIWLDRGTPEARKQLLAIVRAGVTAAHEAILAEAVRDDSKTGMGTTLIGAIIVGNEAVFAHAGDSRAYLVRDGIAMQLTEDQTLLARLLAAGIEVDVSGEGSRFRSMLTNALGIGQECKVATFVVPLADGDRFLLCSDGISEYVPESEVGTVLTTQPSPARAAQKLIELALERGGGDNATALVVRVLEAGDSPQPAELRKRDDAAIEACPLWGGRVSRAQRLRALRIALWRDFPIGERIPAHTLGDRVAWILVEGELERDGITLEPGAFVYPESLVPDSQAPDRDSLAVATTDVRALAIRADDFRELCDDDAELGEALLEALAPLVARRSGRITRDETKAPRRASTDTEFIEGPLPARPRPQSDAPPAPEAAGTSEHAKHSVVVDLPDVGRASTRDWPPRDPGRAPTPLATPRMSFDPPAPAPERDPAAVPRGGRQTTPPFGSPPQVVDRPSAPGSAPAAPRPRRSRPTTPLPPLSVRPGKPTIPPAKTPTPAQGSSLLPPTVTTKRPTPVTGVKPVTPPKGSHKLPQVADAGPPGAADSEPIALRIPTRAITEPEIETVVEIEAEPPPEPVEPEDAHEEMILEVSDSDGRVRATVIDDSDQTITLSVDSGEPQRIKRRTITPQDGPTAAGAIDLDEADAKQQRRPKRISEGWEEEWEDDEEN
jgi:serine/threonine protein phosphatase PrpC